MTSAVGPNPAPVGPGGFRLDPSNEHNIEFPMANHGAGHGGPPHGAAPLPHVDDITVVPKDIDPNQSMKKLLETAEVSLRSAEVSRSFGRPANALRDYVKAYYIVVVTVKKHSDYHALHSGRSELNRQHTSLLRKIDQLHPEYERIKQDIKADNSRTGVQPTARQGTLSRSSADIPSGSRPAPSHNTAVNGGQAKAKPVVHPKPQALHGNVINGSHSKSQSVSSVNQDSLAARFSALRGPSASPGQDPRIKTHPIQAQQPPKPAGPREMPVSPKVNASIGAMPSFPKMPAAIYSPVRGNMSEETARLPTSTPRGFSRTNSASSTPSTTPQPPSKDYFSPTFTHAFTSDPPTLTRTSTGVSSAMSSPRRSLDVAPGELITAQELFQFMKVKGSLLIIDIRSRQEFDDGHIMTTSIICIEPDILARENISCDDISESLVLSPNHEKQMFDKRHEFDLVVIYDESSRRLPSPPRSAEDMAIMSLHRALVHLSYGKELRQAPKLLKGGIDSWVDLLGPSSLQYTSESSSNTARLIHERGGSLSRRKSKYLVKPMKPDDVKAWQETLENDNLQTASSPNLYRSTEEFMRRFPAVSLEQESMTAPVARVEQPIHIEPPTRPPPPIPNRANQFGDLPAPPTRPAPAIPRPSHSGLAIGSAGNNNNTRQEVMEQPTPDNFRHYTGLSNPHNWCYANSVLQALLASESGKELLNSEWKQRYHVPKKKNEKSEQPQLMMQILSNLFHWMSAGNFKAMKAGTLMNYSRHVSNQARSDEVFGDHKQHDAQEFMSFVLTHLDDETNVYRDREGYPAAPKTSGQLLLQAAVQYWNNHLSYSSSLVDKYWRTIELSTVMCHSCQTRTYSWNTVDSINCSVGQGDTTLEKILSSHTQGNDLDDYRCDTCHANRRATQSFSYPRMPSVLCIVLKRFGHDGYGATKSLANITWDLNDLDMAPYFLHPSDCEYDGYIEDKAFTAPFRYECYAVVEHTGGSAQSGHYTAFVRDPRTHDPSAWLYCNDAYVDKVRMDNPNEKRRLFKDGNRVPYIAFFRRKGGS